MENDYINFQILKKKLTKEKNLELKVATDSMSPLIAPGERIFVKSLPDDLKVFDLIVYWDGEKLLCHFLWNKDNLSFGSDKNIVTRSLKEPKEFDIPVKVDSILGIVTSHKMSFWQKAKILLINFF